ncbi:MAG: nuclear receptor NHR-99 [bacterium]|nr:MAG: nuclear receptor NHR-99 [bacterium]
MERKIAEKLVEIIIGLDEPLNDAAALVEQIDDEQEKRKLRRGLGEIMGRSFTDLILPIIQEYPDLDPDKDRDWWKTLKEKRSNGGDKIPP